MSDDRNGSLIDQGHAKRTEVRTKFRAKNALRRLHYQPGNYAHQRARMLRRRVDGAFGRDRQSGDLYIGTSGGASRPAADQGDTE